jgi:hypothetical protein
MKNLVFYLFAILIIGSCQSGSKKVYYEVDPNNHEVKALEVIQSSSYTYINAKENGSTYWLAVALMDASPGKTYHYSKAMEMNNFYSKDLDRTFDKIYFVSDISLSPIPAAGQKTAPSSASPHGDMKPVSPKMEINIAPREGSITIAELYAEKEKYNNQRVKIVGEVTRYNPGIMNRNWVHIQDGTGEGNAFDLTVTTLDHVSVGDQVVIEGILALDKDFGSGYFYPLIVEEAEARKIVVQ